VKEQTDVKTQTDEICKLAVVQNGYALRYVREQTDEICKLVVVHTGSALQYVKEKTDEICKIAVANWFMHCNT
jgi:hydrogenase maturation factor